MLFENTDIENIDPEEASKFLFNFSFLQYIKFCLYFSAIGTILGSQTASSNHFQSQIVAVGSMKRVIENIFKISK